MMSPCIFVIVMNFYFYWRYSCLHLHLLFAVDVVVDGKLEQAVVAGQGGGGWWGAPGCITVGSYHSLGRVWQLEIIWHWPAIVITFYCLLYNNNKTQLKHVTECLNNKMEQPIYWVLHCSQGPGRHSLTQELLFAPDTVSVVLWSCSNTPFINIMVERKEIKSMNETNC